MKVRPSLVEDGYNTALFCRIFTAVTFGFLEPSFLLLALFSCVYSVQVRGRVPSAVMCGSVLDEILVDRLALDLACRGGALQTTPTPTSCSSASGFPFRSAQLKLCAPVGTWAAGRVLIAIAPAQNGQGRCGRWLLPYNPNALDKVLGAAPGSGCNRDTCLGFGRFSPSVGSGAQLFAFTNASPRLALSQPAAHLLSVPSSACLLPARTSPSCLVPTSLVSSLPIPS